MVWMPAWVRDVTITLRSSGWPADRTQPSRNRLHRDLMTHRWGESSASVTSQAPWIDATAGKSSGIAEPERAPAGHSYPRTFRPLNPSMGILTGMASTQASRSIPSRVTDCISSRRRCISSSLVPNSVGALAVIEIRQQDIIPRAREPRRHIPERRTDTVHPSSKTPLDVVRLPPDKTQGWHHPIWGRDLNLTFNHEVALKLVVAIIRRLLDHRSKSSENIALAGPALIAELAAVDRQRLDEAVIDLNRTIPIASKDLGLAACHSCRAVVSSSHSAPCRAGVGPARHRSCFIFDTAPSTTGILVAAERKGT